MTLTPLDIENTKFRGALSGYNRSEVDALLARVSQELEARLRQIEDLQRKITELERSVATYRESEELLKNSVVLAQRTSDEIIAAAHQQADAIKRDAESMGRETSRRLGELRAEREQFEYAFHGLLAGFLTRLEQGNPALAARQPAAGLQAPQPPGSAQRAETAGHSEQLMREAGGAGARPGELPDPPPVPDIPVPPVPGVPAPGAGVSPLPDDFEHVIEHATPAPREQWPRIEPLPPGDDEETGADEDPVDDGGAEEPADGESADDLLPLG